MNSHGTCPYCGHVTPGTVVKIQRGIARSVYRKVFGFIRWKVGEEIQWK